MALQALQLKEHQNTQHDIEEVKKIMRNAHAQSVAADVHRWLKAADATIDYNAACQKRHVGTGQWFIQSATFTTWLQQDNAFLWLHGFAGCGKSVLCSTAIQHTFRHQRSQPGCALAFFFFTFNDESKQDVSAMLRALLLQLSGQMAGMDADLTRLKNSYNHGTPPVPILMQYLRQAVTRSQHTYLLLDALDECPAGDARDNLLSTIQTMRQWSLPGLHLLFTSREVIDIRQALNVEVQYTVALKNDSVSQDILRYVSHQVDHDPQLRRWGDHRETIKHYLAQRANGVFRWVECQLRPLRRCAQSVKHLKQCLGSLPESLDATYERMLCDIGEESVEEAQRILPLLCFSSRPLSVMEIIEAIAVDIHHLQRYDYDRKLGNSEDLLRICPGLINIQVQQSGDQNNEDDEDDMYTDDITANIEMVRIAHFSVQEYLLSDRIKHGRATGFAMSSAVGHLQISKACLMYLCNEDFLGQSLTPDCVAQYPFARFAAHFWHHHWGQPDIDMMAELEPWIQTLLLVEHNFNRWIRLYDADRAWDTRVAYDEQNRSHASNFYYVALLGFDDILSSLLSCPQVDVNAQGGEYGNALQAASVDGHEKVVQILLDAKAKVNAQGGEYGNALQAASVGGHEKVVQMLLDAKGEVNTQGGEYGNALQAASAGGHEKVVQMLLDAKVEVNARGGEYGNALQAASAGGHEKVVQILLNHGVEHIGESSGSSDVPTTKWTQ